MISGTVITPTVVIIGRGRFARTLLARLHALVGDKVRIVQCYRENSASLAAINAPPMHGVHQVPVSTLIGEEGLSHLQEVLGTWIPSIIVSAASGFSPYGTGHGVKSPFGATLPFQLPVALNVAKAAHSLTAKALMLNVCYPELVNPVARLLDVPFDAGLGNAQTLNWEQPFSNQNESLLALAHHSHLGQSYRRPPLMYCPSDGSIREPEPGHLEALEQRRSLSREERNDIGANAAARLVAELFTLPAVTSCLPGVGEETGAVPVSLSMHLTAKTRINLNKSDLMDVHDRHQQECLAEGWDIRDGSLELTPLTHAAMGALAPDALRIKPNDLETWISKIEGAL